MSKTTETLQLEQALIDYTVEKRIYGCPEVTIGFWNQHLGKEHVDFMTMDSHGIIKCYELKVTLSDMNSKANLSWYGNYNYIVVSESLYADIEKWKSKIPDDVGIIVGTSLSSKKKSIKRVISIEETLMLKESLVRSLYYKYEKFRLNQNEELYKRLKKANLDIEEKEMEIKEQTSKLYKLSNLIYTHEQYKEQKEGKCYSFKKEVEEEMKELSGED